MPIPPYRWLCRNCQAHNDADAEYCTACNRAGRANGVKLAACTYDCASEDPAEIFPTSSGAPQTPLLALAKFFWWAGVLFVPLSIFLASHFGSSGHGGPGGWGSGFFILLLGSLAISPTLIIIGILALLLGEQRKKKRPVLASLFGLLLCGGLLALAGEAYLMLLFLQP